MMVLSRPPIIKHPYLCSVHIINYAQNIHIIYLQDLFDIPGGPMLIQPGDAIVSIWLFFMLICLYISFSQMS